MSLRRSWTCWASKCRARCPAAPWRPNGPTRSVRETLHRTLAPLLLAAALTMPSALPLLAETAEPGELEKLQKEIGTSLERQKELQAQAEAARTEAEAIRAKLIETAARVQTHEADVSASEDRLQGLKGAEAVLTAQLERRKDDMAELLAALTR